METMEVVSESPQMQSAACTRCGRALKDVDSVAQGMGPVCRGKAAKSDSGELLDDQKVLVGVGTLDEVGLVCLRQRDGSVACNVPHMIKHHSPDGFEIGYGGSGPADLALNVLHQLIPATCDHDFGDGRRLMHGQIIDSVGVSAEAYRLHQDFKWSFIAPMSLTGGHVPIEKIRAWIQARLS